MANMSYCRFENTYRALLDCFSAVERALDAGLSYDEFVAGLSSDQERAGFERLRGVCRDFILTIDELRAAE